MGGITFSGRTWGRKIGRGKIVGYYCAKGFGFGLKRDWDISKRSLRVSLFNGVTYFLCTIYGISNQNSIKHHLSFAYIIFNGEPLLKLTVTDMVGKFLSCGRFDRSI